MSQKLFVLELELTIRDITCPGVWLCHSGDITLQVYLFGNCIQTNSYQPTFPVVCMEKMLFHKKFDITTLAELQNKLNKEVIYIEFIQWKNEDSPCVLAAFRTNLGELLYPASYSKVSLNTDLLMEPTDLFPGIIAPKIGIKTKTTIKEIWCKQGKDNSNRPEPVTHKHISRSRNRKVCHSFEYSRRQHSPRKKTNTVKKEEFRSSQETTRPMISNMNTGRVLRKDCCCRRTLPKPVIERYAPHWHHTAENCPICITYDKIFQREDLRLDTNRCVCCCDRRCCTPPESSSLSRKLNEKVKKTLNSIPRAIDCVQSYCKCQEFK